MKYQEGQKVTVKGNDWYNQEKTSTGFVVFREGNKVCTFSPGMEKFCGQTFTVNKVVTGSSLYPDHYTFVEDGGAYKWNDEMIQGVAEDGAETYSKTSAAQEQPKPTPKPAPAQKPEPKPAPAPKTEPKPEQKPEPKPAQKPEPKPEPNPDTKSDPVEEEAGWEELGAPQPQPQPQPQQQPQPQPQQSQEEITAFESYTVLLKPRDGADLKDCSVQAYKILVANEIFPSVQFDFNNVEIQFRRK